MELQMRTIDYSPIRGFPDIGQFVICGAVFMEIASHTSPHNAFVLSDTGSAAGDFLTSTFRKPQVCQRQEIVTRHRRSRRRRREVSIQDQLLYGFCRCMSTSCFSRTIGQSDLPGMIWNHEGLECVIVRHMVPLNPLSSFMKFRVHQ